jgi:hypothetical protein
MVTMHLAGSSVLDEIGAGGNPGISCGTPHAKYRACFNRKLSSSACSESPAEAGKRVEMVFWGSLVASLLSLLLCCMLPRYEDPSQ